MTKRRGITRDQDGLEIKMGPEFYKLRVDLRFPLMLTKIGFAD